MRGDPSGANIITPGSPALRGAGFQGEGQGLTNTKLQSFLRVLVAALWDKKLAFRTRERRKILDFYGRTATQEEKEIFGRAVLRFNSASEKESVLLIEDQTDL
ncbi:hypothetical protein TNCV_5094071 [Trichonephila clavipes]|nr:hypothetical protein TNCV_5094071 [Trichonephila clavipes]